MIYEAKDFVPGINPYAIGWNGTHRGKPVNIGTYVWMAEVEFVDNITLMFKGSVTIIR
jgi:hypothetical protein